MFFDDYVIEIGEGKKTPFRNEKGVYQDGTTPMYRDADGTLWAMSGHSHAGHVAMFRGTCLDDLEYVWEAKTAFRVGNAADAFSQSPCSFEAGPISALSEIERMAPDDISSEYISLALSGRL